MNAISDVIAGLDGAQIPGGCDHCNAYQTITANAHGLGGFHMITVHHDDDCPWLAARETP